MAAGRGPRAMRMAASLSRLASSAPEYPIVSSAVRCSTASASHAASPARLMGLPAACTCRAPRSAPDNPRSTSVSFRLLLPRAPPPLTTLAAPALSPASCCRARPLAAAAGAGRAPARRRRGRGAPAAGARRGHARRQQCGAARLQNLEAVAGGGAAHVDGPVEATRPQQRLVQQRQPVGRADDLRGPARALRPCQGPYRQTPPCAPLPRAEQCASPSAAPQAAASKRCGVG